MLQTIANKRLIAFRKGVSFLILLTFLSSIFLPPQIAQAQVMPIPGSMVLPTAGFNPAMMVGMTINPENPLQFDFIIDQGDDALDGAILENESTKLINYFLTALTVPEDQLWVNLSPYEKDRIIADDLSVTEMGRDMLAQDYLLKQLTASLLYPEDELGNKFWQRVRTKALQRYGTTDVPTNVFNKVWIVPAYAHVFVRNGSVFVVESHLNVMLEEDYLALDGHNAERVGAPDEMDQNTKEIIREVILPEIEHEINTGKNFANLRQIYNSMILATWYKKNLRTSLLGEIYMDQNLVRGVDHVDASKSQEIYNQYLEAFKVGVFDYIKEEVDPVTEDVIPRKYFSGGLKSFNQAQIAQVVGVSRDFAMNNGKRLHRVQTDLAMVGVEGEARADAAMVSKLWNQFSQKSKDTDFQLPITIKEDLEEGVFRIEALDVDVIVYDKNQPFRGMALRSENKAELRRAFESFAQFYPNHVAFMQEDGSLLLTVTSGDTVKALKENFFSEEGMPIIIENELVTVDIQPLEFQNFFGMDDDLAVWIFRPLEWIYAYANNLNPNISQDSREGYWMVSYPVSDKEILKFSRDVDLENRQKHFLDGYSLMIEESASSWAVFTRPFRINRQGMKVEVVNIEEADGVRQQRIGIVSEDLENLIKKEDSKRAKILIQRLIKHYEKQLKAGIFDSDYNSFLDNYGLIPGRQVRVVDGSHINRLLDFEGEQKNGTFLTRKDIVRLVDEGVIKRINSMEGDEDTKDELIRYFKDLGGMSGINLDSIIKDLGKVSGDAAMKVGSEDLKVRLLKRKGLRPKIRLTDRWFVEGHPGYETYHDINHSADVGALSFLFALSRGLPVKDKTSGMDATFLYHVGLLHDFDPDRDFFLPAKVPATIKKLDDDYNKVRSLDRKEGESFLQKHLGWNEKQFLMAKAIIQRTEHPFGVDHPNTHYFLNATNPVEEYYKTLQALEKIDSDIVRIVMQEAAIFSEYVDKSSALFRHDFDFAYDQVRYLAYESIALDSGSVRGVNHFIANNYKLFTQHLGKQRFFGNDQSLAQEFGIENLDIPTLEELLKKIPDRFASRFQAIRKGQEVMGNVYKEGWRNFNDAFEAGEKAYQENLSSFDSAMLEDIPANVLAEIMEHGIDMENHFVVQWVEEARSRGLDEGQYIAEKFGLPSHLIKPGLHFTFDSGHEGVSVKSVDESLSKPYWTEWYGQGRENNSVASRGDVRHMLDSPEREAPSHRMAFIGPQTFKDSTRGYQREVYLMLHELLHDMFFYGLTLEQQLKFMDIGLRSPNEDSMMGEREVRTLSEEFVQLMQRVYLRGNYRALQDLTDTISFYPAEEVTAFFEQELGISSVRVHEAIENFDVFLPGAVNPSIYYAGEAAFVSDAAMNSLPLDAIGLKQPTSQNLHTAYHVLTREDFQHNDKGNIRPFTQEEMILLIESKGAQYLESLTDEDVYHQGQDKLLEILRSFDTDDGAYKPFTNHADVANNRRFIEQNTRIANYYNHIIHQKFPDTERFVYMTAGMGSVYANAYLDNEVFDEDPNFVKRHKVFSMSRNINVPRDIDKQMNRLIHEVGKHARDEKVLEEVVFQTYAQNIRDFPNWEKFAEEMYDQLQVAGILDDVDDIVFVEDATLHYPLFLKFIIQKNDPMKRVRIFTGIDGRVQNFDLSNVLIREELMDLFGLTLQEAGHVVGFFLTWIASLPNPMIPDMVQNNGLHLYDQAPADVYISFIASSVIAANEMLKYKLNTNMPSSADGAMPSTLSEFRSFFDDDFLKALNVFYADYDRNLELKSNYKNEDLAGQFEDLRYFTEELIATLWQYLRDISPVTEGDFDTMRLSILESGNLGENISTDSKKYFYYDTFLQVFIQEWQKSFGSDGAMSASKDELSPKALSDTSEFNRRIESTAAEVGFELGSLPYNADDLLDLGIAHPPFGDYLLREFLRERRYGLPWWVVPLGSYERVATEYALTPVDIFLMLNEYQWPDRPENAEIVFTDSDTSGGNEVLDWFIENLEQKQWRALAKIYFNKNEKKRREVYRRNLEPDGFKSFTVRPSERYQHEYAHTMLFSLERMRRYLNRPAMHYHLKRAFVKSQYKEVIRNRSRTTVDRDNLMLTYEEFDQFIEEFLKASATVGTFNNFIYNHDIAKEKAPGLQSLTPEEITLLMARVLIYIGDIAAGAFSKEFILTQELLVPDKRFFTQEGILPARGKKPAFIASIDKMQDAAMISSHLRDEIIEDLKVPENFYKAIQKLNSLVQDMEGMTLQEAEELLAFVDSLSSFKMQAYQLLVEALYKRKVIGETGGATDIEFLEAVNKLYPDGILTREDKLWIFQAIEGIALHSTTEEKRQNIRYIFNRLRQMITLSDEFIEKPDIQKPDFVLESGEVLQRISSLELEKLMEILKKDQPSMRLVFKDGKPLAWQYLYEYARSRPYFAIVHNPNGTSSRMVIKEKQGIDLDLQANVSHFIGNNLISAIGAPDVWLKEGSAHVYIREIFGQDMVNFRQGRLQKLTPELQKKFFFAVGVAMSEAHILGIEDRYKNLVVNKGKLKRYDFDELTALHARAVVNIDRESALNEEYLSRAPEIDVMELNNVMVRISDGNDLPTKIIGMQNFDHYLDGVQAGYDYHRKYFKEHRDQVIDELGQLTPQFMDAIIQRLTLSDETVEQIIKNVREWYKGSFLRYYQKYLPEDQAMSAVISSDESGVDSELGEQHYQVQEELSLSMRDRLNDIVGQPQIIGQKSNVSRRAVLMPYHVDNYYAQLHPDDLRRVNEELTRIQEPLAGMNTQPVSVKLAHPFTNSRGELIQWIDYKRISFNENEDIKTHEGPDAQGAALFDFSASKDGLLNVMTPTGKTPLGGILFSNSVRELVSTHFLYTNDQFHQMATVKTPMAVGYFPDAKQFNNNTMGFVMLGVSDAARERADFPSISQTFILQNQSDAPLLVSDIQQTYGANTEWAFRWGQLLRTIHEAGVVHHYLHSENISLPLKAKPTVHDLDHMDHIALDKLTPQQFQALQLGDILFAMTKVSGILWGTSDQHPLALFLNGYTNSNNYTDKDMDALYVQLIEIAEGRSEYGNNPVISEIDHPVINQMKNIYSVTDATMLEDVPQEVLVEMQESDYQIEDNLVYQWVQQAPRGEHGKFVGKKLGFPVDIIPDNMRLFFYAPTDEEEGGGYYNGYKSDWLNWISRGRTYNSDVSIENMEVIQSRADGQVPWGLNHFIGPLRIAEKGIHGDFYLPIHEIFHAIYLYGLTSEQQNAFLDLIGEEYDAKDIDQFIYISEIFTSRGQNLLVDNFRSNYLKEKYTKYFESIGFNVDLIRNKLREFSVLTSDAAMANDSATFAYTQAYHWDQENPSLKGYVLEGFGNHGNPNAILSVVMRSPDLSEPVQGKMNVRAFLNAKEVLDINLELYGSERFEERFQSEVYMLTNDAAMNHTLPEYMEYYRYLSSGFGFPEHFRNDEQLAPQLWQALKDMPEEKDFTSFTFEFLDPYFTEKYSDQEGFDPDNISAYDDILYELYFMFIQDIAAWWKTGRRLGERKDADDAMKAPGGVDFNPVNMDMQESGDAMNFKVDPSAPVPVGPIQGLRPVIIQITPVTNFPLLLGYNEEEREKYSQSRPMDPTNRISRYFLNSPS